MTTIQLTYDKSEGSVRDIYASKDNDELKKAKLQEWGELLAREISRELIGMRVTVACTADDLDNIATGALFGTEKKDCALHVAFFNKETGLMAAYRCGQKDRRNALVIPIHCVKDCAAIKRILDGALNFMNPKRIYVLTPAMSDNAGQMLIRALGAKNTVTKAVTLHRGSDAIPDGMTEMSSACDDSKTVATQELIDLLSRTRISPAALEKPRGRKRVSDHGFTF